MLPKDLPELPAIDRDYRDLVPHAEFWEAYYARGRAPWDSGEAAPPLLSLWSAMDRAPGRMLVLGCGSGADAVAFAKLGHDVAAIDFAPSAVVATRARATAAGVSIDARPSDVLALPDEWTASFDYALEHTCYCAISPDDRDGYVSEVARVLKPGGLLLALLFNHGRSGGPPFDTSEDDVRARFPAAFAILRCERALDSWERLAGEEFIAVLEKRTG